MSQPDQRLLQWKGMEGWVGQTMLSFVTATMRLQFFRNLQKMSLACHSPNMLSNMIHGLDSVL